MEYYTSIILRELGIMTSIKESDITSYKINGNMMQKDDKIYKIKSFNIETQSYIVEEIKSLKDKK